MTAPLPRTCVSAAAGAAAVCAALAGCAPESGAGVSPPEVLYGADVRVERVVDGDTLIVDLDGERTRVRVLGIDAPELARDGRPAEPCAEEAEVRAREIVGSGGVTLIGDESQEKYDQYGRLLAFAEVGGEDLGLSLLSEGLAEVYRDAAGIERFDDYRDAEASAPTPACAR